MPLTSGPDSELFWFLFLTAVFGTDSKLVNYINVNIGLIILYLFLKMACKLLSILQPLTWIAAALSLPMFPPFGISR